MSDVKKLQLVSFMSGMFFYTPVMTLLLLERNISIGFIVAAQTVFSIAMVASELPTGVLADKFGQKVSIRLGLLLDALGMLQLIFVHSHLALLVFFAVRGVSIAFRSGSDEALLYELYAAENKTAKGYSKAYGRFLSNDVLGFIVATAVSGVALQFFGESAYIPLVTITGLATLLALAFTFTIRGGSSHIKLKQEFNSLNHLKRSLKLVTKSRTIFALALAGLLTLNGEYFLRQSYQPYFESMTVPAIFLGLTLSAGKLLNYFVIRYSHLMERYLSVDQIILWVNLASGGLFIAFAVTRSAWVLVVITILILALLNAERPVVSDYVNQQIESHNRSTVLSAVSLVQNFGQILARLALAASIGLVGIGTTYAAQGTYLILGAVTGAWYLRRCGCVHRVKHSNSQDDLSIAKELVR